MLLSTGLLLPLLNPLQGVRDDLAALNEQAFRRFDAGPVPEALHGVWESRGYGWIVHITDGEVDFWDHCPAGTMRSDFDLEEALSGLVYRIHGDVFQWTMIPGSSTVYTLTRRDQLPEATAIPPEKTPIGVFDYFFGVMEHHYAYFEKRGVDWLARRKRLRPRVTSDMSEEALWEVLRDALADFHDDHLVLYGTVAGEKIAFDDGLPRNLYPALDDGFANQDDYDSPFEYRRGWGQAYSQQVREDLLGGAFQSEANGNVTWGRIGNLGYINLRAMAGFSEEGDPHSESEAAHEAMSAILNELSDTDGIVLDITLNSGGWEEVQMAVSSHFVDQSRPAFSKRPLDAEGAELQEFHLYPAPGTRYLGPVWLVTSDYTVSAAEDFTLAMRELPHVTHVGSRTRGAFSDVLEKALPNGWTLTLSNEEYLDVHGDNFETIGVTPEVQVPIFVHGSIQTSHVEAIRAIAERMAAKLK